MSTDEERMQILSMIDSGQITAEEGLRLIRALEGAAAEDNEQKLAEGQYSQDVSNVIEVPSPTSGQVQETVVGSQAQAVGTSSDSGEGAEPSTGASDVKEEVEPPKPSVDQKFKGWRHWWQIPLWAGVFITVLGGVSMYLAYRSGGFGFWFACAWFPLLLGVLVMALAWASRNVRWLHVRVQQKEGQHPRNIAISIPLPLRLTAWFVRTFGSRIPSLDKVNNLDQMILALENISPDAPFSVDVDDDGEKVQVFIG